jgi:hypothetical protein
MRAAVVELPCPRLLEPEVGAEVDDRLVRRQPGDQRGRLAVRQRQEDHVGTGQRLDGRLVRRTEDLTGQLGQLRMQVGDRPARRRPGQHRADLERRVPQEEPEQLPAGVPARADDAR